MLIAIKILLYVGWIVLVSVFIKQTANQVYLNICSQFHTPIRIREQQVHATHRRAVLCWVILGPLIGAIFFVLSA